MTSTEAARLNVLTVGHAEILHVLVEPDMPEIFAKNQFARNPAKMEAVALGLTDALVSTDTLGDIVKLITGTFFRFHEKIWFFKCSLRAPLSYSAL